MEAGDVECLPVQLYKPYNQWHSNLRSKGGETVGVRSFWADCYVASDRPELPAPEEKLAEGRSRYNAAKSLEFTCHVRNTDRWRIK